MPGVILEVLFVPRKPETLAVIRRAVETMDINLQICNDPEEVERLLFCHRYDGLILDHDESTERLLRALRQSPSSRTAIAIDVHDDKINLQTVFALGANFEMVYPLTIDRARRTLSLAIGLMMLGRRRYYRHPVEMSSRIVIQGRQFDALLTNVSQQGLGIRCDDHALNSGTLQCAFMLPDNSCEVVAEATVVWADRAGQAGCHIEQFRRGQEEYQAWLSRLFHQCTTAPGASLPAFARFEETLQAKAL